MAHNTWHHPIFIDPPYFGRKRHRPLKKLASAFALVVIGLIAFSWHNVSFAQTGEFTSGELVFKAPLKKSKFPQRNLSAI